jgi:hypothetical protein
VTVTFSLACAQHGGKRGSVLRHDRLEDRIHDTPALASQFVMGFLSSQLAVVLPAFEKMTRACYGDVHLYKDQKVASSCPNSCAQPGKQPLTAMHARVTPHASCLLKQEDCSCSCSSRSYSEKTWSRIKSLEGVRNAKEAAERKAQVVQLICRTCTMQQLTAGKRWREASKLKKPTSLAR